MGRVYGGAYAELIGDGHEGYAAKLRPEGSLSSSWTGGEVANLACCGCGWHGQVRWPAGEEGEAEALAEWDADHLQSLIATAAATWPAWVKQVGSRARQVAGHIEQGRPDRAELVMARLAEDVEARRRVVDGLVEDKTRADVAARVERGGA